MTDIDARQDGAPNDPKSTRYFDGVICFGGEDWWYHNRGHFDMRIMRELRSRMPVLYVNSIGMRTPRVSEGRMFLRRIGRKLKSLRRGLVPVDRNFSVVSPIVAPSGPLHALTMPLLPSQVRLAAKRSGITRPLLWVNCPTAAEVVEKFDPVAVVYQRTDRYESYEGIDHAWIAECDAYLKARADLTVFCSSLLLSEESADCRESCFVDHGVNASEFVVAAHDDDPPDDIAAIPGPRVGFVGGIDRHTFDPELFNAVAQRLPEVEFVLVGGCSLPRDWCREPNVTMLGQKPLDQVSRYMAACDVLIMPWNRSPWIEACNPIKLKEYLATGRPIVSTPFHELGRYTEVVRSASTPAEFARAIEASIEDPGSVNRRRARVVNESWTSRANEILSRLRAQRVLSPSMHEQLVEVKPLIDDAVTREPLPMTRPSISKKREHSARMRSRAPRPVRCPVTRPDVPRQSCPIDACIMLAGGLTPSPLVSKAECSVLDLWIGARGTLMDHWIDALSSMPTADGSMVPMHVVTSNQVPVPWPRDLSFLTVEQEPRGLRGPAGVVADVARRFDDDATLLIVEAARCMTSPLDGMINTHVAEDAAITVGCNPDLTPSGVYLARAGIFREVPPLGFMDLKEQFLNRLLDGGERVVVHPFSDHGAMPLRTRAEFLAASAALRSPGLRGRSGEWRTLGVVDDASDPDSSVICPGAIIGRATTIVDSIVMPGAVVEDGAFVVRSLICPGSLVQEGTDIADAVAGTRQAVSHRDRNAA